MGVGARGCVAYCRRCAFRPIGGAVPLVGGHVAADSRGHRGRVAEADGRAGEGHRRQRVHRDGLLFLCVIATHIRYLPSSDDGQGAVGILCWSAIGISDGRRGAVVGDSGHGAGVGRQDSVIIGTVRFAANGDSGRGSKGRCRLISATVGDDTVKRIASISDGVLTLYLPIAIAVFEDGLHGVHRQGLAAGGDVEGLHGSLRREGGSVGVADVHIRLVARPSARQSGKCRRGNVVGISPIVRVTAGAIRVGPSVSLGAGAAIVGAASHRASHGKVTAIGSRGDRRRRHHGISSAGYIAAPVGRKREISLGDGIDVIPLGSFAGTIGISIGICARALAGERIRVVRRVGDSTSDGLFTLARGSRDGGRRLGTVHTSHRLGSLDARGVHGRLRGAVNSIDIPPYELAVHTILVGVSVGNRSFAGGNIFSSLHSGVNKFLATHIPYIRQCGGSGGSTHTFHRIGGGHRTVHLGRRGSTLDGIGVGPSRRLVVTILIGIDKRHRAFAVHRVGGTGQCPLVGDVVFASVFHRRHHARRDKVRGHRVRDTLDGAVVGTTRDGEGGRQAHDYIGRALALTTVLVCIIDHIGIGHIVARRSRNCSQVVVRKVRSGNRVKMGHAVSEELPRDSVHRGGHVGKGGGKAHIANIGTYRGIPHCDGGYRMCGYIHSYRYGHRSTHTDTIGRDNSIGQHNRGGIIVHQVLTVYCGLVDTRSSTAHIVTIRTTSRILRRLNPAVLGAVRSGRCNHEGTARTDVLRIGTHLNSQVIGQAHGELGRL